jgi:hypothetical protein
VGNKTRRRTSYIDDVTRLRWLLEALQLERDVSPQGQKLDPSVREALIHTIDGVCKTLCTVDDPAFACQVLDVALAKARESIQKKGGV